MFNNSTPHLTYNILSRPATQQKWSGPEYKKFAWSQPISPGTPAPSTTQNYAMNQGTAGPNGWTAPSGQRYASYWQYLASPHEPAHPEPLFHPTHHHQNTGQTTQQQPTFNIPDATAPFMSHLLDSLNLADKSAKEMGPELQGMYSNLMRQSMGPQGLQGTLNNLSSRGLLDSFVARDALSRAATNTARNVGNMGYNSFLQGLNAKMGLPGMWASAMNTATQDQMAPYQIMSRMLTF